MEQYIRENLALKISAAFLLKNGEISTKEISSLPFVNKGYDVRQIVNFLINSFDAEIINKKVSTDPFLQWEEVVQLKHNPL